MVRVWVSIWVQVWVQVWVRVWVRAWVSIWVSIWVSRGAESTLNRGVCFNNFRHFLAISESGGCIIGARFIKS